VSLVILAKKLLPFVMQQLTFPRPKSADFTDKAEDIIALRGVARLCVLCQFWLAVICLGGSILLDESAAFSVFCGVLACVSCLIPIGYALLKREFFTLFSCITIFNLAPIWFLYLEVILPGNDAYKYSQPIHKMEALFWAATFQFFVNLLYMLLWKQFTPRSIYTFKFLSDIKISSNSYIVASILAFFIPIFAFFFYYDSLEILWKAMTAGREGGGSGGGLLIQDSLGGSSAYMLPFTWLWQLTPLFGTIAFTSSSIKWRAGPLAAISLGLIVIFFIFLGGSRSIMMFVAAPVLFFLFYYNWDKGLKFWGFAIMLLFLIIGVMELQVRFRGNLLGVLENPDKAAYERGIST
jgi:hypothetical protein